MPEILHVKTAEEYAEAVLLFEQYARWLNIDLSFQHFSEELEQLQVMYAPPFGGILLCKIDNEFVGCIAIRKISPGIAELKRMFVKPAGRQKGIGSSLLNEALLMAEKYGYKKIRLDTLSNMSPAINLYKKNGFYEIPAYYYNPEKTAVYFEKMLG